MKRLSEIKAYYDIDGMQTHAGALVLEIVNRKLGTSYRPQDIDSFDFVGRETRRLNGDDNLAKKLESYWSDPDIQKQLIPYAGVKTVIRAAHAIGIDQGMITTRPPACHEVTREWVGRHQPFVVKENKLHIRPVDSQESGRDFKRRLIEEQKIDLFFEDEPQMIKELVESGYQGARMFDQPWNRANKEFDNIRVKGAFGVARAIVEKILEK